jgi:cytochrome c oxidase assembly factor CtaG
MVLPSAVHAHAPAAHELTLWTADPLVVITLAFTGAAYALRVRTLWREGKPVRTVQPWQATCFGAGLAALGIALIGPLDALAAVSFSMHMIQHMLLMVVAAPLLALGAPLAPLLHSAPRVVRRWVLGRGAALTRPFVAFLLNGVTVWFWHAPGPYEAALASEALHVFEHVTFLFTALLFWHSLLQAGRNAAFGHGAGAFWSLATVVHSGLLGALLTFATTPLYPSYRHAMLFSWTPLEDQQLAGLIMWIPAGLVYLAAGLLSIAAWLRAMEGNVQRTQDSGSTEY